MGVLTSDFVLSDKFIELYKKMEPKWGPLGEFVYYRTYSRLIEDKNGNKRNEEWWETVKRVVEGTFNIQKQHCENLKLPWKAIKAQKSAQKMYEKIFNFKFLPPGRGLWAMGTQFVTERGTASLNNCGFISTDDIQTRGSFAFTWVMDASMLGVGCGFDTKGAGKIIVKKPKERNGLTYVIPDTREGWVESVALLIDAFFEGKQLPVFDYSLVRPYGTPIKGFGGVASGPGPLMELHTNLEKLFVSRIDQPLTSVDIVDIMDMIGACVVSGNVRRTALLALGDVRDKEYTTMKDYTLHPEELQAHRWASNNSVFAEVGKTDYTQIANSIALNGEPGIIWLENMRAYGRMNDPKDYKDAKVAGVNPCKPLYSLILTDKGYITFSDALQQKSLSVITSSGKTAIASKPFLTGKDRDVYKITFTNGVSIYGTEEHRHLTRDNTWKRMDELKVGDDLKRNVFNIHDNYSYTNELEYEDGILTGWLYADGSLSERGDGGKGHILQLAIGEHEFDYTNTLERITGISAKPHQQKPKSCLVIRTRKKDVCERVFRHSYNMDKSNLLWLYGTKKDFKLGFIRAFFTTDGSVRRKGVVEAYSVNRDALETVANILQEFGINCGISTHAKAKSYFAKDGKLRNNKTCYKLVVYNGEYEKMGFLTNFKNDLLKNSSDHIKRTHHIGFARIADIDKNYDKCDVYDITVEDEQHAFLDSGIIAHNCSEQTLESGELCCLIESFPSLHETLDEFKETLKYAYLYGKTVTLLPTHWPETNAVMMRNRRIGTSMTGITDAFVKHGRTGMLQWSEESYQYLKKLDEQYSSWLSVPKSIKITTVKPSGSVSLLPGVSAGIHYPHSEYYIRRVRADRNLPIVKVFKDAGYDVENSAYGTEESRKNTIVISFPIHEKHFSKKKSDVSIWEQVKNAVDFQRYWSDNSVSITVTFKKEEIQEIANVLYAFEDQLKSISFLPLAEHGYQQAPYEEISKEKYDEMVKNLKKVSIREIISKTEAEKFCTNDSCEI